MTISNKLATYIAVILGVLLVVGVLGFAWTQHQHQQQVIVLQNEVAKKDSTVETQRDVYAKLAVQYKDASVALDTSSADVKRLAAEVKKTHADLLSVQSVVVKLRSQVGTGTGTQTTEPSAGAEVRTKVAFGQDFGYARVDGWTLTNPGEYHLALAQGSRPLKLTVALEQQPDGSWKTLASSSDSSIGLDIGVSAVSPYILRTRWYEDVKLSVDLAASSQGVLGGLGASVRVGQFDLGPKVWGTTVGGGAVFYGGSISWAPFKK